MNVLIVATNRCRGPVPVVPLGACLVAEAVKNAGHRVRLLDLMFEYEPVRALESELHTCNPHVVGLSIRNIDNNDMQQPVAFFKDLVTIVRTIRGRRLVPIVLGGAAVGVMPEELLRYTGAEWAILGDGEVVFPQLLEANFKGW